MQHSDARFTLCVGLKLVLLEENRCVFMGAPLVPNQTYPVPPARGFRLPSRGHVTWPRDVAPFGVALDRGMRVQAGKSRYGAPHRDWPDARACALDLIPGAHLRRVPAGDGWRQGVSYRVDFHPCP